ncbi:hypothetical protein D9757_010054 [Collybiopsis confluens]|uniref:Uncharacterized protein n=1 Tax=Collybiopsis confluens TaxID=2823264 RepID=A0A8H5LYC6_9AGAR|nr:hypothetical protein D9757_010054 [Collybiopsis confluens]
MHWVETCSITATISLDLHQSGNSRANSTVSTSSMSFFTHAQEGSHAEPESASSAPASYDDDNEDEPPPLPLMNTKPTKNVDQYNPWTSRDPSRNIPLPVPPLAGLDEYRAQRGTRSTGHELTTESRDHQVIFYHAGGVLDSPIIHYNPHTGPLSPPPTLPTSTTTLPCAADVEGLEDDHDVPAWFDSGFGSRTRNLVVSLPVTHSATSEPHLLSPLSPEFIIDPAGIHRQRHEQTPSSTAETGDDSSSSSPPSPHGFSSEPMDLDVFLAEGELEQDVEMRPPLEEQEPWLPRSLYSLPDNEFGGRDNDLTPTYPHSVHYRQGFGHTFYPSPDVSPEQSIDRPSASPSTISSTLDGIRMRQSQRERHIGLDGEYDYEDMDYQHDLLGSQSPSIQTLGLPELDDEDDEMDLGLGLSNFASFPPSTFEQEDELPFSSLPSTPSSTWPSPVPSPFATSSATSETHMTDEFNGSSLNLSSSSSTSNAAAGLLLLDPESESDTRISTRSPSLSPPSSISSSISDDSPSSISLTESLESLDSRLFILPSLLGTGEYPTLDTHPDLVGDLNRLMELRRRTQGKVKELECKVGKRLSLSSSSSSGSGSSSGSVSASSPISSSFSSKDRTVDDGREVEGKNVVLRRVALAQTQNERAEARAMRKREKERWKEIGALVQLTVFGGRRRWRHDQDQDQDQDQYQSGSKSKSAVAEAKVVAETVTRDPAMGLPRGEQAHSSRSPFAKQDERLSITNMAQLVARMIMRRRDSSYSPSPSRPVSYVSRPTRSGGLISSPPSGTRRYAKSPLWQSMTISYGDDGDVPESEGSDAMDGLDDDEDDDDDLGLGIGLRLRGFGDFGAPGS